MLSDKHLNNICLSGYGYKTCRYLIHDMKAGKHLCCKKVPALRDEIGPRVDEYLSRAKKNGQDIALAGRPTGDNCQGYLFLKNTLQGYDIIGSA